MLNNLKALVVVAMLAWVVFALAKPLCLRFMPEGSFRRRRNIWFALTIVAFCSPVFWLYALFAGCLLIWAGRRDENPLALFVLVTFTVPNVSFYIPGLIVNQLFDITQYRILSLTILLPFVFRMGREPAEWGPRNLRLTDFLLLAFLCLQIVLLVPYESFTNTLRRSFLLCIDSFVVFYCFSRLMKKEQLDDVLMCFWLACAVMAPIAVFESQKGWLLYTGLASLWGDPNSFAWLFRGDALRAQASAGHSINLGYVLAVGLGLFMYLRTRLEKQAFGWLVMGVFASAMFVTGSRGSWVTGAIAIFAFVLLRPHSGRQLLGAAALSVVLVAVMYATPLKESVLDRLPLIGTADQDTIEYRQELATVSWQLIKQNPFFGDPFVYLQMESLRQGQGIIDIVNGYLYTALFTGGVGLFLLVSVYLVSLARAYAAWARIRTHDPDAGSTGAALLACLVATLVFVATAGFGPTTLILSALLASFSSALSRADSRQDEIAPYPFSSRSAAPG